MAETFTPNRSGKAHSFDEPAPTVQRFGIGDERPTSMTFGDDGQPPAEPDASKPPYRIPLLEEILGTPQHGRTVMSTFSGCGGSCLGFRWAGWRHLLAVEFVDSAVESYRANYPDVPVWTDDIRDLTAEAALEMMGVARGELDCLEGSPPCESFSTSGKRSAGWGQVRAYSDSKQQVMDDLFYEYTRLLGGVQPRSFVAENVSGLAKGVSKGYFKRIFAALEEQGYDVRVRMLDAQWLGVPQRRKRVIFVGTRKDLGLDPDLAFPKPLPYRYSIRDAIGSGIRVVHDTSGQFSEGELDVDLPVPTITNGVAGLNSYHFKVTESRKVAHGDEVDDNVAASLEGYAVGDEWQKIGPGGKSDRFQNLVRPTMDEPCPTVTAQGTGAISGAPGGVASVTHPDEPRKFSIAELRRLCGFPDDFELAGTYAQQWERLGNSVPPPMMYHVACALRDLLPA